MTAILVIEDDPGVREFLVEVMEAELAAVVRCASTGTLGSELIATGAYDLAIIDVLMPQASGYELAKHAASRNMPTLLCSGHPDALKKLTAADCPHLAKPFKLNELVYEAAKIITNPAENIRRVKISLARLQETNDALRAETTESRRLMSRAPLSLGVPLR
jgi:DNA-binding NtrC family response regulator